MSIPSVAILSRVIRLRPGRPGEGGKGIAADPLVCSAPRWQADHVDLTEKLQLKPGQSVAILNPPPGVTLPTSTAGGQSASASAVIGFAVHRDDLDQLGAVHGCQPGTGRRPR